MPSSVTSSQIGWITESVVGAALIAHSNGRISPFFPASDDHGVDLIAYGKETGRTLSLQVKAWTKAPHRSGRVQFDTRKETYLPTRNRYLAALYMPLPALAVEYVWFLPTHLLPEIATESSAKYALACSAKPHTKDRASGFRMTAAEFVSAVLDRLGIQGDL